MKKNITGILHTISRKIKYQLLKTRVMRLPEKNRHKIAKEIYEFAYHSLEHNKGNERAACAVVFECFYDSHMQYYTENVLTERCENEEINTDYYTIKKIDNNTWCVVVIVNASEQDVARAAADASAMSAILASPMTIGTFKRYLLHLENSENTSKEYFDVFINEKILPLFEEYQMASEIVNL